MIAPNSVDWMKDTIYRVGGYNPEGFYNQNQLNNNMSGNDANAIYYATHDQRFTNEGPVADRNQYRVDNGYKYWNGAQQSSPVWGDGAYVTGAGAGFEPWYDEALKQNWGSPGGIPDELINPDANMRYAAILSQLYSNPGGRAAAEADFKK